MPHSHKMMVVVGRNGLGDCQGVASLWREGHGVCGLASLETRGRTRPCRYERENGFFVFSHGWVASVDQLI